ncbi:amidohydrolase family protein [Ornithinicoccus hortensis]|uniref:Imidazolonepropionase-like amidohydrolase n=1 Tax=Ornithinicoccus hortensis TaxID=82346 RepID=A0A542YRL4_9MICO|nr:amidohydrolase family protein [Ornithinicoccus hortensis]TQL50746.1 imidazolonepropionase-like amidohydrolase [Ornithinicoccus hortensis]
MGAPALHIRGQVLVGPEETLGEVWAIDGRISLTPPTSGEVETIQGWALPGLVDAHCHVGLEIEGAVGQDRAEEHALADRDAGALLLRSPGSPADTSWMAAREDMPVMLHGGTHLARPKRYLPRFAHEIEPADLVEYARAEARASDGWVKFVGDWIDREVGDLAPLWPADVLAEAVAAVHEEGARTTAHCFAEQSLRDFAAAGTDCIEHACGLQEDTIARFAEQQIAIVPTLVNIANFPKFADAGEAKFPAYAAHMRDLHARRYETVGLAREAGVPVYVGTDAGGQLPHGLVAREVAELTRAGFTALEAIDAATWSARRWLGHPGIEEGAPADLVVYAADPREDLRTLADPHRVVLRGRAHESLGRHRHDAV